MKHNKILCITYLSSLAISNTQAAQPNCNHDNDKLKCLEFVKNYDADTATFNIPNLHPILANKLKISLKDIKAAKIYSKNKCEKEIAKKAKFFTRDLLKKAKVIEAVKIARDKKFALTAELKIDGKDLSSMLIKNKYAVTAKDYKKTNWCKLS